MIHGVDQRSGAIRLWFTAYESTATERVRGVSSLVLRYRFTTSGLADSSSEKTKTGRQFFWRPVGREELAIPAAPATTRPPWTATAPTSHTLAAFILGTKVLFRTSHSATLQSCLSPRATKAMHVPY